MTRPCLRVVLVLVLVLVLVFVPGCVGIGRASYNAYDWAGSVFPPNPVALIPFWIGFVLFGIAGLPLDLLSSPLPIVFFPDEKQDPSREFYWFAALSPTVFLGAFGGTILGGIFYPFGIPFMGDKDDWNSKRPPADDEPLAPPPGGDEPPK